MEQKLSTMLEDLRHERSSLILLSLAYPDILKES